MSTIPTTANLTFWGVNTTFQWSGATYKTIADATLKYGNKIHEELVTGQNAPYLGTGGFHGELDITALGSSDNQMWNSAFATSGIVPTMGLQMQSQDTSTGMSGRIWYFSGKTIEYQQKWSKDGYVEFKCKLILALAPVVS